MNGLLFQIPTEGSGLIFTIVGALIWIVCLIFLIRLFFMKPKENMKDAILSQNGGSSASPPVTNTITKIPPAQPMTNTGMSSKNSNLPMIQTNQNGAMAAKPMQMAAKPVAQSPVAKSTTNPAVGGATTKPFPTATGKDPFSSKPQSSVESKAKQVLNLLPYIKQYRAQKMTDPQIKEFLHRYNWPDDLIDIALESVE